MKMYIAVLDEVPDHMVPVLVAHSVLGAHFTFSKELYNDTLYNVWLDTSFKKVVLKVNRKELRKIAELDDIYLGHEKHTLHGIDSCVVVCPREDNPKVLTFAKMWKPNSPV